jgi:lipase ATG15
MDGDELITYDNVYNLARMSYNAYLEQDSVDWFDTVLNKTIDVSLSHNSVHAYLFSNDANTVHVVAFKGTSIYWSTKSTQKNSTVYNDKFNDNLYFSCCYYKESNFNRDLFKDCSGKSDAKTCSRKCYQKSLSYELNYFNIAKKIMDNVFAVIDKSSRVTLTGHSLGGTLSTIMGIVYDKPVVTFESPGEKHYIDTVGLKYSDATANNIYHFGHNADIIFTGKCNGVLSWCSIGGYTLNTKCHIGNVCEYDTKTQLGMRESIFTHKLKYVIDNVITKWNNTLPSCKLTSCTDCETWDFT